jgi:Poxvirus serine/threonine protein kinase
MESAIATKDPYDQHVYFEASEGEIKINEPPKSANNWHHGDLKPNNILSFKEKKALAGSWWPW